MGIGAVGGYADEGRTQGIQLVECLGIVTVMANVGCRDC
jgi:hypothetical protein